MPHIIPIKDLKNTAEISELCRATAEPVFITKNGYGDMVIMSMETYEKNMLMNDVFAKLEAAEDQIEKGEVLDAKKSLVGIRAKYGL
jgi:PHD/YefM family antitoxin component YafN of YafNO toxin-antitoxin module